MMSLLICLQQEAMESQSRLKQEQYAMAETLKNLQKKLSEEKSIFSHDYL